MKNDRTHILKIKKFGRVENLLKNEVNTFVLACSLHIFIDNYEVAKLQNLGGLKDLYLLCKFLKTETTTAEKKNKLGFLSKIVRFDYLSANWPKPEQIIDEI